MWILKKLNICGHFMFRKRSQHNVPNLAHLFRGLPSQLQPFTTAKSMMENMNDLYWALTCLARYMCSSWSPCANWQDGPLQLENAPSPTTLNHHDKLPITVALTKPLAENNLHWLPRILLLLLLRRLWPSPVTISITVILMQIEMLPILFNRFLIQFFNYPAP